MSSIYDVVAHPDDGPAWLRILKGTVSGGVAGAGFSQININGLYRVGGSPVFGSGAPYYQAGHGVDHADTIEAAGVANSTRHRANFSPQERAYNEGIRNPLVRAIRGRGNAYAEITTYTPAITNRVRTGEPVSTARWVIEIGPNGDAAQAWQFPTNATVRNPLLSFQADLATYFVALGRVPSSVLSAAKIPSPGAAAGAGAGAAASRSEERR